MQPAVSYVKRSPYLNTNVDEADYSYINKDVPVPNDRHQYEELRHAPHTAAEAGPEPHNDSRRHQPTPEQAPASGPDAVNTCCSTRPNRWGWAVIIAIFVVAATVVTLCVYLATMYTTTPASTISGNRDRSGATTTTPTSSVPYPKNCQDVFNNAGETSRVYSIYPDGRREVKAYCEQTLDGGGWTVFQRRIDGSVDFYLGWAEYKRGFGNTSGEYWLGNDNLHALTVNRDQKLKVELQYGGETVYADYNVFAIDDEANHYMLTVVDLSVADPPGDSLAYSYAHPFTTKDRDNNPWKYGNCAHIARGAWWYYECYQANLNGLYNHNGDYGVNWVSWKGKISLSAVRMMLKPR